MAGAARPAWEATAGASGAPCAPGWRGRNVRLDDYRIERLAGDVAAVLDAERLTGAVAIGHSMGCQVALQLWRARRELVAGLVLVTGPFASPMRRFYGREIGAVVFPPLAGAMPLVPMTLRRAVMKAPRLPLAMPVARAVRALGPYTPGRQLPSYFRHLGELEPMLQRLPDAELRVIADGTHGALIEFPDELHDAIADFLRGKLGAPHRAGFRARPVTRRERTPWPPRRSRRVALQCFRRRCPPTRPSNWLPASSCWRTRSACACCR